MIKNIVFDIGGVLADFHVTDFLAAKGFDGPMIKRILKASIMTPYWGQFERGELTEEEALAGFAGTDPEITEDLARAFSSVEGMLTPRDWVIPLLKELKEAGYGVYYLSNYSRKAYNECGESLNFMPYMDGGIVSFRVGMTKPDPGMYEYFLKEYGLTAGECVFVDDTPENVDIARRLGFDGIVFEDEGKLREELGRRMNRDPFREYIRESEPDRRDKGYAWHTAIGLQAVDGLQTSEYLLQTAVRNIEGEISFEETDALLQAYYEENPARNAEDRTEEADRVSARIAAILSEKAFSFTPNEYLSIHRKLFTGIYPHAGHIRDYNITKKEWVLNGATVLYGSASELKATLEYDFSEEKKYSYRNLTMEEIIRHLAVFISRLWQIHVFGEGNTRTTAVFFIKYVRTLGFDVTNETFAENAWYFRNSLVRANYNDLKNGIHETTEYLELFLRNLLLGEKHPLHNRTLHISGAWNEMKKPDIGQEKPDIEQKKPDIERMLRPKTADYVRRLQEAFPGQIIFGRTDVMRILGLKSSRASELIKTLADRGIIKPVSGHGKGKYRFA